MPRAHADVRRVSYDARLRSHERGASTGFGVLVGAAVLLLPLILWLTRAPEALPATAPFDTQALRVFLAEGPAVGLWETEKLSTRQRAYFAPMPGRTDRLIMAPAPVEPGTESYCKTCRHPCSYTRRRALKFFFEAPGSLFYANYERVGDPITTHLEDGREAVLLVWRPRHDLGGLRERQVWFEPDTAELIQIEDFSATGRRVRRIRRVSKDTGSWDPTSFDPKKDAMCMAADPMPIADGDDVRELAEDVPFPLVVPTWLPKGFQLVEAVYREVMTRGGEALPDAPRIPARLASLLYSDGVALLSVGVAPKDDMDAIMADSAPMPEGDTPGGLDDASTCASQPVEPRNVQVEQGLVRVRQGPCRTVLRRDDLAAMSVVLLARNELPLEVYLEVANGLTPLRDLPEGAPIAER